MAKVIRVCTWEECETKIHEIEKKHDSLIGVCFRGKSNSEWPLDTTWTFLSNGSVRLIWTVDRFRRGLCLRPGAWATFFAGSGGVGALCHGDASQEQQWGL